MRTTGASPARYARPEDRTVLIMKDSEGMNVSEIAQTMGGTRRR